ncbi:hypothetical protein N7450_006615 [Penicillium hetheringtonii]|uniref:Protein root UVB sensitive/RUS domain-containing protein n=1 Tax=Penicillium hetheringtonii TaxID=911720 RepID=A0AAD6GRW1_9EURO|nr:hypothetical protein N7450_006615 [Penicillium hetheringtonii]
MVKGWPRFSTLRCDSLQAFCSSIAGLLSSRAVLQGVGVGNAEASPTNALLLHILQDTSGRIATILFAHRVGTALEPECKTYRLAADVFNDIAMIMDCLSPMVPAGMIRVSVLSTAGILRALCGVAGGSSKASLSAHFAKWGNLAELNAVGSVVVSHITGFKTTWAALLFLLASHLSLNYAAVRSVEMTSLNRQRASMHRLHSHREEGSPSETPTQSKYTPSNPNPGTNILKRKNSSKRHTILLVPHFIKLTHTPRHSRNRLRKQEREHFTQPSPLTALIKIFNNESYIINLTPSSNKKWHAAILLKPSSTTKTTLKAWCHALITARALCDCGELTGTSRMSLSSDVVLGYISEGLERLNEGGRFDGYLEGLREVGWDVDIGALEVRAGRRVFVE